MTRSLIRRRSLLQQLGAGAFLAAPVFREVVAEAQGGAAPQRLLIIQFPGGARQLRPSPEANFSLKDTDHTFNWSQMLAPLTPHRADIAVLQQIGDITRPGNEFGHVTCSLLTGDSRMNDEESTYVPPGVNSIDQVIANAIGQTTRFPSLQMGMNTEGLEYSLTHHRISYANGARLAPVNDPAVVFSRLFGDAPLPTPSAPSEPGTSDPALERAYALRRSILDIRKAELEAIRSVAVPSEFAKLDAHLTAIRELERSIPTPGAPGGGGSAPSPSASCAAPSSLPTGSMPNLVASMTELSFQAMNCDLTRVITLQWDPADLSFIGVNRGHHTMQHEPAEDFDRTQTWYMEKVAELITRFKSSSEGGSSLLDNTAILVLSEQTDGMNHTSIPILGFVAGSAGGKIRTGANIVGNQSSMNDFYIGLARAFGVAIDTFGEAKFVKSPLSLS